MTTLAAAASDATWPDVVGFVGMFVGVLAGVALIRYAMRRD